MKYLIVGLGNIGAEYENTRHNIGFIIADAIAKELNTTFVTNRYASIAQTKYKGKSIYIIKPNTYMNLSGKSFKYWQTELKIDIENTLTIVDDIDLDVAAFRLKTKGSGGTHNGLNNIIEILGKNDFPRLRVGIGKNYHKGFQVDYVLGKFTKNEENLFIERIPIAVEIVKNFIVAGSKNTMNQFNNK